MIKKILSLLLITLCSHIVSSQVVDYSEQLVVPEVLPVSPTAAEIGLYGNIATNLSTGRLGHTIPLYNIKAGGMSFPLEMNYSHGGLMAEQDPTSLGLGWSLNFPGAIVRQLQQMPDDDPVKGYIKEGANGQTIGKNNLQPLYNDMFGIQTMSYQDKLDLYERSSKGLFDGEPDKFSINAPGVSGNFFLNWNKDPVVVAPYENVKVILEQNNPLNSKITVINASGVIYEFDEREETESSTDSGDNVSQYNYITSWFLKKIRFPNSSDEITFHYEEYEYVKITKSVNTKVNSSNYNVIDDSYTYSSSSMQNLLLTSIVFPNGSVEFDYVEPPSTGIMDGVPFLRDIKIEDFKENELFYDFVYSQSLNETSTKKLKTLNSIIKRSNGATLPFYNFEYYPNLPTSLSDERESQDLWGFYNGKPDAELRYEEDRELSFTHTREGALKKIIYPTGGHTEIFYEPNDILYRADLSDGDFYCDDIVYNDSESNGVRGTSGLTQFSFQVPNSTIYTDPIIKITISANAHGINGNEARAEITSSVIPWLKCNSTGNTVAYSNGESPTSGNLVEHTIYIDANPGQIIDIELSTIALPGIQSTASYTIEYLNPEGKGNLNTPIGGIRVNKTEDCDGSNNCISKVYKYNREDGISSGIFVNEAKYITNYSNVGLSSCYNNLSSYFYKSFSSNVPMATYSGSHVLYKRVEILENGTITNGKTVQWFSGETYVGNIPPWAYVDYEPWKKGKLIKEEKFINKNGQLAPISLSVYDYSEASQYNQLSAYNSNKLAAGFKAQKYITRFSPLDCGIGPSIGLGDFYEKPSSSFSKFFQLNKKTETKYQDNGEIITTTDYLYDSENGLLIKETNSTSDLRKIVSSYKYPKDLIGQEPNMDSLIAQNRIGAPIVSETLQESPNKKLFSLKNEYSFLENVLHRKYIYGSKGQNNFEKRVVFHKYDSYGNIIDVSNEGGIRISYIYGYHGKFLLAKIENMTYTNIPNNLINGTNGIITISNSASSTENDMLSAFQNLRNDSSMENSLITTFTYLPLFGVSTITDPKGDTHYYQYDSFGRLINIKDKQGHILEENEYRYRNQQP